MHSARSPRRSTSRRAMLRGTGLALAGAALPAFTRPSSAAGVTLKVLVNTPHLPIYTTYLAPAWNQATGGVLEASAVDYTRLTDRIIDDVHSGAAEFDLFDYYYYGLGAIAHAGALVDLTHWTASRTSLHTRDFLPSTYDAYTQYRGRRYGLPYDGDQQLIFYNSELLDAYGLQPPTTWDAYDAVARRITQKGGGDHYGAVVQGQPDPMVLGCAFINRLNGYGGDLVDGHGRPTLTTPAAVAAARHLVDIAPYALPTPTETGFDTATSAFLAGRVALIENWTGIARRADDPSLSKIAGKWGVTSLPLGDGNRKRRTPLNGGYGLGVSAASQHRAAALTYLEWATSRTHMLLQTTQPNSAIDPNRSSVLHSPTYAGSTPDAYPLIRAGLDATPLVWPKGPADPDNLRHLVEQLALAVDGRQSPLTALRTAQAAWRS